MRLFRFLKISTIVISYGLDEFLRGTKVLVCVLPLTSETSNMLGRNNLAKLPDGSYLINVARGAHVAEPDLLAFIKSGHIASATLSTRLAMAHLAADNLIGFLTQGTPITPLNPKVLLSR